MKKIACGCDSQANVLGPRCYDAEPGLGQRTSFQRSSEVEGVAKR
jgi:hypothetical protein